MQSQEIRETFLSYFEKEGHKRLKSASLVPASFDPSVLLTTAGMQPLKPYFQGAEEAPSRRLTSSQKCFRTTDIDQVGLTARHLTFFEMLGNFSIGDYFKEEAIRFGWELSIEGFKFEPDQIWVTVFAGDKELGLGPDEEAIDHWRNVGVPEDRIIALPRAENFWQAGPTGPCGPCSELYLDRGEVFGGPDDRPGDDTDRFVEYWNLVFMQYDLKDDGMLEPLPQKSIDTGLGLDRVAAILQDAPSVFENDLLKPLFELAEKLSHGGEGLEGEMLDSETKAFRVLADHGRAMTFLLADGVVPSNEDRGYILRRIMRRAIVQGRLMLIDSPFLGKFSTATVEMMGDAYPELKNNSKTIKKWVDFEEENFLKTLDQGMEILGQLVDEAKQQETSWISAADAFKLHDTFGFPYDLTKELIAESGLSVDDAGFHELMEEQRQRARVGTATAHGSEDEHNKIFDFAKKAGFRTDFTGYEQLEQKTKTELLMSQDGKLLAKFPESPFYAEGGGQVSDSGIVVSESGRAKVVDVIRIGDDQVVELEVEDGEIKEGEAVRVTVDAANRHATACNHTATHLLHAALRERLGDHVRQAGSAVRPDKLRFDFTHGAALTQEEVESIEQRVNDWISANTPVRGLHMSREEAEKLGAMALFGEKYGEWVRVIEVEDVSRELCGGTHVRSTSEIGGFKITGESSSAANVRRIEALTGPELLKDFRERDKLITEISRKLKTSPENVESTVESLLEEQSQLKKKTKEGGSGKVEQYAAELAVGATDISGTKVASGSFEDLNPSELRQVCDVALSKIGEGTVTASTSAGEGFSMAMKIAPAVVESGVKAGELINMALEQVGGSGGGRDTMAQGGAQNPEKEKDALKIADEEIKKQLSS